MGAWTPEQVERLTGLPVGPREGCGGAVARRRAQGGGVRSRAGRASGRPRLLEALENLAWASGALTGERAAVLYAGPQNDSQGALDMGLAPDLLPGYVRGVGCRRRAGPYESSWGASLPHGPRALAPEILAAAADGRIRALWIVGRSLAAKRAGSQAGRGRRCRAPSS